MSEPFTANDDLRAHFERLPASLQRAIHAVDVGARLREIARTQRLHIDQDALLETEVAMALTGIQDIQNLEHNVQDELGIPAEAAQELTNRINEMILQPIREELERELEHPEAKAEEKTGVEAVGDTLLAQSVAEKAAEVVPATAAQPEPATSTVPHVVRAPASGAYKPGETSAARKDIHDDPYRESLV